MDSATLWATEWEHVLLSSCHVKSGKFPYNYRMDADNGSTSFGVGLLYLNLLVIGLPEPHMRRCKMTAVLRFFFVSLRVCISMLVNNTTFY